MICTDYIVAQQVVQNPRSSQEARLVFGSVTRRWAADKRSPLPSSEKRKAQRGRNERAVRK